MYLKQKWNYFNVFHLKGKLLSNSVTLNGCDNNICKYSSLRLSSPPSLSLSLSVCVCVCALGRLMTEL